MKENNKLVNILANLLFFEIRIRRSKWKIH
jgi:hypothetical protein